MNGMFEKLIDFHQRRVGFLPLRMEFDERRNEIRQPFTERIEPLGGVHLRLMEVRQPLRELRQRLIGVNQRLTGPNERLIEVRQRHA